MDDDLVKQSVKGSVLMVSTFFYVVAIPLSNDSITKSVHFKGSKIGYIFI
jgi:hypothetical protein